MQQSLLVWIEANAIKRRIAHFMVQYLMWSPYENLEAGHMERMLFMGFHYLISGNLDWSVC